MQTNMKMLMIPLVYFTGSMDDMKQFGRKSRNSHLPKFDRYSMAQLQMDAAGLKGFTVNSTICNGRTMLALDLLLR